jgi:hypothetical protein
MKTTALPLLIVLTGCGSQAPAETLCQRTTEQASGEVFAQFVAMRGGPALVGKVGDVGRVAFQVEDVATDGQRGPVVFCTATFRLNGDNAPAAARQRLKEALGRLVLEGTEQTAFAAVLVQLSALPSLRGQYAVRPLDNGELRVEFAPGALTPAR